MVVAAGLQGDQEQRQADDAEEATAVVDASEDITFGDAFGASVRVGEVS